MTRRGKLLALSVAVGMAFFIFCNHNPQENKPPELSVEATASDSIVAVRDTLFVTVEIDGAAGRTIRYCWARENSWTIDTTAEARYTAWWPFPDTGVKQIIVWAIDQDGRRSNEAMVSVRVAGFNPDHFTHDINGVVS